MVLEPLAVYVYCHGNKGAWDNASLILFFFLRKLD